MTFSKPITKKQMKGVVAEYALHFPDWEVSTDGTAFSRKLGPVEQIVWFQALRTGAYRPMHALISRVLPEPHIRMLPLLLGVRNRESTLTEHVARMPGMLTAMEQQFKPDVRRPLDLEEVLALCDAEANTTSANDQTMLAILNTWVGHDTMALDCCERVQRCPQATLAPMPEWERTIRDFARKLCVALQAGTARPFLEGMIKSR